MVGEALRHLQQHVVAGAVAERVIDDLEAIEVQVQHCDHFPDGAAAEPAQPLVQPVHEHGAVGHPGEWIGGGPQLQGGKVNLAFGDVAHRCHHDGRISHRVVPQNRLNPTKRAVPATEAVFRGDAS
jgi:hypothetical protein